MTTITGEISKPPVRAINLAFRLLPVVTVARLAFSFCPNGWLAGQVNPKIPPANTLEGLKEHKLPAAPLQSLS